MRLDAHQHFWHYDPAEFGWIDDSMSTIQRDFLPSDLKPILKESGIDGCVAVQAPQTLKETEWLLELADQNDFIKGVVGWVDLRSPSVWKQLHGFIKNKKFKGVRHIVQAEPDSDFLLRPDFSNGIAELSKHNLAYDILIFPQHLPCAIQFVDHFARQCFVIDHLGKPHYTEKGIEPWASQMKEIGKRPNVYCKLSGMTTEADWKKWKPADFQPYIDTVLEAFGPKRIMYGSDWPVCLVAGTYAQTLDLVLKAIKKLSADEQAQILGDTCAAFYRI
ncbi:MAG: amidohydrolase family protein [Fimbriimonadaceae bacterium]|nr:amidohydrolase family protein [Fimbriimonadaceae bacterium]